MIEIFIPPELVRKMKISFAPKGELWKFHSFEELLIVYLKAKIGIKGSSPPRRVGIRKIFCFEKIGVGC
jgi:hypothetical protein